MIYGYPRVSTRGQAADGYGLEQQEQEILDKYPDAKIFKESYTGKTTDRPVFNRILSNIKEGDILVVCKLDRLARNTAEGIEIIERLFKRGVSVHVLNFGLLEDSTMGRFFIQTMLAIAEMERNIIIERTQSGKSIAKLGPDFKDGRPPKFNKKQVKHALELLETNTYKEVEILTGISKSTLVRAKRKVKKEEFAAQC